MSMLFSPLNIRSLELPNRLLRSATWEGMADDRGYVSDALVELYRDLARGGVGLIITGYAYVSPEGKGLPGQTGIYEDGHIEGLSRIAAAIHDEGGRAIVQIVHAGGQTNQATTGCDEVLAPSAVHYPSHNVTPRAFELDEIKALVDAHGQAARRAMEAGFDGIQIHAAHGYLANRFLSPTFNVRDDEYGGDIAGRARFGVEIIKASREALGAAVLSVKLNSEDFEEEGLTVADAKAAARLFVAAGVDHLEISGGTPMAGGRGPARGAIDSPDKEAYFGENATRIKQDLGDVPVGVVGGIRSFEVAEDLVVSKGLDTVSLCRPLISEPDLPRRWLRGDRAAARCTSCSKCFGMGMKKGIRCAAFKK